MSTAKEYDAMSEEERTAFDAASRKREAEEQACKKAMNAMDGTRFLAYSRHSINIRWSYQRSLTSGARLW
jgi:hypothetical protein